MKRKSEKRFGISSRDSARFEKLVLRDALLFSVYQVKRDSLVCATVHAASRIHAYMLHRSRLDQFGEFHLAQAASDTAKRSNLSV